MADGLAFWGDDAEERVEAMLASMRRPLSPEMVRLIIAARVVAFGDQSREAIAELDAASEAFAADVPWSEEDAKVAK